MSGETLAGSIVVERTLAAAGAAWRFVSAVDRQPVASIAVELDGSETVARANGIVPVPAGAIGPAKVRDRRGELLPVEAAVPPAGITLIALLPGPNHPVPETHAAIRAEFRRRPAAHEDQGAPAANLGVEVKVGTIRISGRTAENGCVLLLHPWPQPAQEGATEWPVELISPKVDMGPAPTMLRPGRHLVLRPSDASYFTVQAP